MSTNENTASLPNGQLRPIDFFTRTFPFVYPTTDTIPDGTWSDAFCFPIIGRDKRRVILRWAAAYILQQPDPVPTCIQQASIPRSTSQQYDGQLLFMAFVEITTFPPASHEAQQQTSRPIKTCFRCRKPGYFAKTCLFRKSQNSKPNQVRAEFRIEDYFGQRQILKEFPFNNVKTSAMCKLRILSMFKHKLAQIKYQR